jgi:hypothetical protein
MEMQQVDKLVHLQILLVAVVVQVLAEELVEDVVVVEALVVPTAFQVHQ